MTLAIWISIGAVVAWLAILLARRLRLNPMSDSSSSQNRCDECKTPASGFVIIEGRKLCGDCFQRLHPEKVVSVDRDAIKRRIAEMKWCRLVDLPGYQQWSQQYQGLDCIIGDLNNYSLHVHPDELGDSMEEMFEGIFQGRLDDAAERGAPRRNLHEFRR